jgi:hypothetical protein
MILPTRRIAYTYLKMRLREQVRSPVSFREAALAQQGVRHDAVDAAAQPNRVGRSTSQKSTMRDTGVSFFAKSM